MSPEAMRRMLKQTFDDHRLSRSERQALGRILEHLEPSDAMLSQYRQQAFEVAREVSREADNGLVIDWLEDVARVLQSRADDGRAAASAEACFSPDERCPQRIAGLFRTVKRTAEICVFTITDDRISEAILEAHQRGVQVRIISDDDKAFDPGSDIHRLADAGIPTRVDRSPYHMHHKFALFDRERLLSGSYNWTRSAANVNQENFIITGDIRLIRPFADLFEQLWTKFE